jgi:anti-anti-sigma regulatory factor
MIRITETYEDEKKVRLKIDGKIVDPCIWVLEKLCCHYIYEKEKEIILDLEGVTFIDEKGLHMLGGFKDNKIKSVNCSPFIRSLINSSISRSKSESKTY